MLRDALLAELGMVLGAGGSYANAARITPQPPQPKKNPYVELEREAARNEARTENRQLGTAQSKSSRSTSDTREQITSPAGVGEIAPQPQLSLSDTKRSAPEHVLDETSIGHEDPNRIPRDDRKRIIFALLKQRTDLTVKDITKSIPGFSEKTIQRELVNMVEQGVIVRKGEKRWTTYAIPNGHQ